MEILSILDTLEDVVEKGVSVPFSGKCMIDKEEMLEIIQEMRLKLPDDIKQAKWIKEERQRILLDAQKEADHIVEDAENRIVSMVDNHEITRRAQDQFHDIVTNAQKSAKEIRTGTKDYADGVLSKVEDILMETVEVIRLNKKEFK